MSSVYSLSLRLLRLTLLVIALAPFASTLARAADMSFASGSPLAGIAFDDKPLLLPVQRDFQMAMLTAGGEIGRGCGTIEAYGWRLSQKEQDRVNQLFNSTVDRMRAQGYAVESKAPKSVSQDITMFTADRPDHHLLFMWSAGEIGLVMLVCETTAPAEGRIGKMAESAPPPASNKAIEPFPYEKYRTGSAAMDSMLASQHGVAAPTKLLKSSTARKPTSILPSKTGGSPVGDWRGTYACTHGLTGGTLTISSVNQGHVAGMFRFYPTARNPYALKGAYTFTGDYDAQTQRVLIAPGKWIHRPMGYSNASIVGSFDLVARTFSGYFQGITGCTSFEASLVGTPSVFEEPAQEKAKAVKKEKPTATKKKAKKKAPVESLATPSKTEEDDIKILSPTEPSSTTTAPTEKTLTPPSAAALQPLMEELPTPTTDSAVLETATPAKQ